MASKRMFSLQVVDTDAFLEMPLSSQALYFHLSMRADDHGFVSNPQKIMRMINATKNDYDILLLKRFIIPFDNGICVIKHWRINNYIQKDRYRPTTYTEQRDLLEVKENGAYTLKKDDVYSLDTACIQNVSNLDTQNRLDKNRTEENRKDENDLNTASAYAEVSADRSDGLTDRTEKLTCVSQRQNTAVRSETDGTAPMQPEGTEPVKPDNLCPNQPEVPDPTASAMGGPVGSVGLTASNADADDDDNDSDAADAEGGKKTASVPPCPHKDIVAVYHEVLPELRAVRVWNAGREKKLRSRWREDKSRQSLEWWRSYFESVRQSDFLMGRKTDWAADFDWLICPTNMAKVLEGKYHDGPASSGLPQGMADRLEALFRDLASAWPADRIGDAKEARRLFFAVFPPQILADKDRANMRLSNIEAWAQVVLGREAQYVPRLDRWMSGLDPDIAPADNGEREEVA